jgi:hypothetical protein
MNRDPGKEPGDCQPIRDPPAAQISPSGDERQEYRSRQHGCLHASLDPPIGMKSTPLTEQ